MPGIKRIYYPIPNLRNYLFIYIRIDFEIYKLKFNILKSNHVRVLLGRRHSDNANTF
jgi:hypothetical protein